MGAWVRWVAWRRGGWGGEGGCGSNGGHCGCGGLAGGGAGLSVGETVSGYETGWCCCIRTSIGSVFTPGVYGAGVGIVVAGWVWTREVDFSIRTTLVARLNSAIVISSERNEPWRLKPHTAAHALVWPELGDGLPSVFFDLPSGPTGRIRLLPMLL